MKTKLSIRGKIALLTGAMVFLAVMTGIQALQINDLQHRGQQKVILHQVDSAVNAVGKVTAKEVIDGRYTLEIGAYGKYLVTKEQYESVSVGDDVPEFLKGKGS